MPKGARITYPAIDPGTAETGTGSACASDKGGADARFKLLGEANSLLLLGTDPIQLIQEIAEKVMVFLDCDVFFNYVFDTSADKLHLNAFAGVPEQVAKDIEWLERGTAICGCVAVQGRRIVSEDIQANTDVRADLVRGMGVRAYACHPLSIGGETIGTLSFGTKKKDFFTDEELALMKAVTDQVAVAMQRKRAEQELHKSEDIYRTIVTAANEGIAMTDESGVVTYANRTMASMLGYEPDELVGMDSSALIFEEDLGLIEARARQLNRHVVARNDMRIKRKDGTLIWLMVSSAPLFDENGGFLGAISMCTDIDARREAEATSSFQAHLLESVHDAIVATDSQLVVTYWNQMATELFGWEPEEAFGSLFPELLRPQSSGPKEKDAIASLFAIGYYSGEIVYLHKDGHPVYTDVHSKVVRGSTRSADEAVFSFRNISRRKAAEQQLIEAHKQAEDLITHAPSGIYEVQFAPPRFTRVNDAMSSLTGYTREELLAMNPFELLDEDSRRLFQSRIQEGLSGRVPASDVEYTVIAKDGRHMHATLDVRFIFDEEGVPGRAFVIAHDVTEHRHLEEERAALLSEERTRRKRIESLHRVLEVAVSSPDATGAATRILDYLHSVDEFDLASLWLERAGSLEMVASINYPESYVREFPKVPVASSFEAAVCFRTGKVIAVASREDANTEVAAAYDRLGIDLGAYIVVPLRSRGARIGVLAFVWSEPHEVSADDLGFYSSLGNELGVVLENARLYESEHSIAETLQDTLVVIPSDVPGLRFSRAYESATSEPGRVGGDFVDVFHLRGDWVGLSLGDVSGKGVDAAVITSLIRTTLRVHAVDALPPWKVVDKANEVLRKFTETESFATLWFGELDTKSGQLRYVCAGHPPALVLSGSGEIRPLECRDAILGAFDDTTFAELQSVLVAGDRLILYSDGVTEAKAPGGRYLGEKGLLEIVRRNAHMPTTELSAAIMKEVVALSHGVLRDDAAILVAEPELG